LILRLSLSRKGTHRAENRDFSGWAHNAGAQLYVIADGTSKPGSGQLAKAMIQHVLDAFAHAQPTEVCSLDEALKLTLTSFNDVHSNLCPDFPFASTSYLALLVLGQTAITIHAGDCCLGHLEKNQPVTWLSSPHCGPNWKGDLSHSLIASSPARKQLLNCMSHRRSHEPRVQSLPVTPDTLWVLATDGFWAELSPESQLAVIAARSLDAYPTEDDVTCLLIHI
jgi:serine/threonine protein phosphatase PrpC